MSLMMSLQNNNVVHYIHNKSHMNTNYTMISKKTTTTLSYEMTTDMDQYLNADKTFTSSPFLTNRCLNHVYTLQM